jgi:hypothetical protein
MARAYIQEFRDLPQKAKPGSIIPHSGISGGEVGLGWVHSVCKNHFEIGPHS